MIAFRVELAAAGLALLWLAAVPAFAQGTMEQGEEGVSGPPRTLQQAPASQPPGEPTESSGSDNAVLRAKPAVLGTGGGAAVQVGSLAQVEGPPAGTLDESNGGLGYEMWAGSERGVVQAMLQHVPATPSPGVRILLHRLLLSVAPPPVGPGLPFMSLRINKLMEFGMFDDAADLAVAAGALSHPEIALAQAEALLYAGRDDDACGATTAYRLQSAEPFWLELRAYCYAVTDDAAALELTRSVMAAQQFSDAAFLKLLDQVSGAKPTPLGPISAPTAVHVRMLERLKLPIPPEVANLNIPAAVAAVGSGASDANVRLAVSEKALRAGALAPGELAQVLGLMTFAAQDLDHAATIAQGETIIPALARLRAALKREKDAAMRVELIYTALRIGERERLFVPVATLFASEAAALVPSADSSNWAPLIVRGLIVAGKPNAAERWYEMMSLRLPQMKATINQLQLALALAAPNGARNDESQAALTWLAGEDMTVVEAHARAALYLGLFDALGRPMPPEVQAGVAALMTRDLPGRRPTPLLMQRVERALSAGRRGEAALSIIDALGPQGAAGLAPDVAVRFVRALRTLGLDEAAQVLAVEAAVIPAAGAQG